MISLYLLSSETMIFLTMSFFCIIGLHMFTIVYDFFKFQYQIKSLPRFLTNLFVLFYLFLLLTCLAEAVYQAHSGFLVLHSHALGRNVLWCLIALTAAVHCCQEGSLRSLYLPLTAALTLPITEKLAGSTFPVLFTAAMMLWLGWVLLQLIENHRQRKHKLSVFSVKEAVDHLDFGILFYRASGVSAGHLLLTNQKMQDLMFALTGFLPYDGRQFTDILTAGTVLPECHKNDAQGHLVYTLPDGSTWWFEHRAVTVGRLPYTMLLASDITQRKKMTDELAHYDEQLMQRNRELRSMLQNMDSICRAEEHLRAKNRIHDSLGQQISLLLRPVREHRTPDEKTLRHFADSLTDIRTAGHDHIDSLNAIAASYQAIGVSILVDGSLPPQPAVQKLFIEIITEAISNAVRHGYATEVSISLGRTASMWSLRISDNGTLPQKPITEGGGLTGIRRKVAQAGGSFHCHASPCFEILVTIPGGYSK